jgi:uncharacterized phage infection (PIP) family protein YhgE
MQPTSTPTSTLSSLARFASKRHARVSPLPVAAPAVNHAPNDTPTPSTPPVATKLMGPIRPFEPSLVDPDAPFFSVNDLRQLEARMTQAYGVALAQSRSSVAAALEGIHANLIKDEEQIKQEEKRLLRAKAAVEPLLEKIEQYGEVKLTTLEAQLRRAEKRIAEQQVLLDWYEKSIDPLSTFPNERYAKHYWNELAEHVAQVEDSIDRLNGDIEGGKADLSQHKLKKVLKDVTTFIAAQQEHMDSIQNYLLDLEQTRAKDNRYVRD